MMCAGLRNARGGGDAGAGLKKQKFPELRPLLGVKFGDFGWFLSKPLLVSG